MRQPMYDYERPCVMGGNCECNFIGTKVGEGFTAVEFPLPTATSGQGSMCSSTAEDDDQQQQQKGEEGGGPPAAPPSMCVLCHRRLVQSLFYDIIYAGSPYRGIIQLYGNICNQENEYARSAFLRVCVLSQTFVDMNTTCREMCLICPPNGPVECMPLPSVCHQRNKYSVIQKNGVKYIRQHLVGVQDFR